MGNPPSQLPGIRFGVLREQRTMKLLASFAILTLPMLSGCTPLATAVANLPAAFGDYERQADISYGADARQALDVYAPEAASGLRPVVVFFYGGGWRQGEKAQYRFVAEALTSRGYIVVVPDYRLFPKAAFPDFMADAAKAVGWVYENIRKHGGDPERLFLMGHSAGAHIAALLAFDERYLQAEGGDSRWMRAFVGLAGPYDFLPFTDPAIQAVFAAAGNQQDSQPIAFVDGREVRTLLLHGEEDDRVWPRNSRRLAERIREKGGSVEERYYPGMTHGGIVAALSVYLRGRRAVLDEIDGFLAADPGKTSWAPRFNALPRELLVEQRLLSFNAPAVAGQAAIVAHDAMTRDGYGDRIGSAGTRDGTNGLR